VASVGSPSPLSKSLVNGARGDQQIIDASVAGACSLKGNILFVHLGQLFSCAAFLIF
jgi:hypothetical protein